MLRSALGMSAGTFISRVLGLMRDMAIGAFFSRTETDAFFVAFRAPNFFRRFLGEGALSISFIPIFVQHLCDNPNPQNPNPNPNTNPNTKNPNPNSAKNFMNSVYTILLGVMGGLTALGVIFIEPVLYSVFEGSDFASVAGKMHLTSVMARLLFVYLFLVSLYAYFMGIANALGRFFIPALAPACLNIAIIIFAFLPKHLVPFPPLLLCYGVLAGGAAQVIMTAFTLYKLNFLPRLTWQFTKNDLKLLGGRFVPGVLGAGGFALVGLLNLYFAGWLEEGAHTFIYYGDRLLELPRSLIAISLGAALLPNLSYLYAKGQKKQMLSTAASHRDILLFLVLPCAVGFWLLGLPIVEVLFQRGRFSAEAAQNTALVLQIYSLLLVSSSLSRVFITSFYAVKNTWYPAAACGVYVVFHWFLALVMVRFGGLAGLAGATAWSNVFFLLLLIGGYPFFVGRLYLWRSVKKLLWSVPALTILWLYLLFCVNGWSYVISESAGASPWLPAALLFYVILSSIGLYMSIAWLTRLPQAKECLRLIKNRTQKSPSITS